MSYVAVIYLFWKPWEVVIRIWNENGGITLFWREPRPFYWKRYISSQMGVAILKCSHSLRSSLILVTTYQGFHMRYHLHMYSTLIDEKIVKIVRNLGLKTCLCRSICPPVYVVIDISTVFVEKETKYEAWLRKSFGNFSVYHGTVSNFCRNIVQPCCRWLGSRTYEPISYYTSKAKLEKNHTQKVFARFLFNIDMTRKGPSGSC